MLCGICVLCVWWATCDHAHMHRFGMDWHDYFCVLLCGYMCILCVCVVVVVVVVVVCVTVFVFVPNTCWM